MDIYRFEKPMFTTVRFETEECNFSAFVFLVQDTNQVEVSWSNSFGPFTRFAMELDDSERATPNQGRAFIELLTAATDMADQIEAGTFDITSIPERKN